VEGDEDGYQNRHGPAIMPAGACLVKRPEGIPR
jgi:hypothetical protein